MCVRTLERSRHHKRGEPFHERIMYIYMCIVNEAECIVCLKYNWRNIGKRDFWQTLQEFGLLPSPTPSPLQRSTHSTALAVSIRWMERI